MSNRGAFVLALVVSLGGARVAAADADASATLDAGAPDGGAGPDAGDDGCPDGSLDGGDEVRAPALLAPVVPEYPPEAITTGFEASVVLKVDVDAEGKVTGATVVRGGGYAFDAAARAAALRARFRPARRAGRAVASRVSMRVEFHPPAQAPAPPPPAVVAPPPARHTPAPLAALDVKVRGESQLDRHRRSAETVTIIDTERAKREAADMGEVLNRAQGVNVRQEGGLGSDTRVSINGLIDDQVRFFLDGIPLELSGYPFGIANVPVNLVDAIEIYGGVVPIRFAADALGGAMNVVTNQDLRGTHAAGSYKVGSFDTHRLTLTGRHLHEPTGFFIRVSGFGDYALNDYVVDVDAPDDEGQLSPARVHRFHDRYRAAGGNVEAGFVDRPWARRLLLRGFVTDYDKQYQSNPVMTVPYGGITYGERSVGGSLRYEQTFRHGLSLEATAAYAFTRGLFQDLSTCVYDWYGRCVNQRRMPGERDGRPHDQIFFDQADFARAMVGWRISGRQALRLALSPPRFAVRTGDERRQLDPTAPDSLTSKRRLITMINGLEHQADLVDARLENIAFAKQFLQILDADEVKVAVGLRHVARTTFEGGVGDGVRYRLADGLWVKASYEWATRLPRPDEVFGDNGFITANLDLQPETSHNANLGLLLDRRGTRAGAFRLDVNGFGRFTKNLIVMVGNDRLFSYRNVYGGRSVGVEGAWGWRSPRELVVLEGSFTWQDLRNTSSQGTFGAFAGVRIPNRPYLSAYALARLQLRNVVTPNDELSFSWSTRYVHEFYRSWESIGDPKFKQVIPSQTVQIANVGYLVRNGRTRAGVTLEAQNLTDRRVYDYFGVQRPGRAFYTKATVEF